MAIQNRRGAYVDFNPSKLLPGEPAVVQSGDPNSTDGSGVYVSINSGNVKRLVTADELETAVNNVAEDLVSTLNETVSTFVNTTAPDAVSAVTAEGATQVSAVDAKGAEVLESIPQDYTDLSDTVDDLKDAIGNGVAVSADQLISDNYTEDRVPYLYRTSGGDGADRAYDTVVGGSVVWNQWVKNGDFSDDTTNWGAGGNGTLTVSNGVASLSFESGAKPRIYQNIGKTPLNHIVLHMCQFKQSVANAETVRFGIASSASGGSASRDVDIGTIPVNTWVDVYFIRNNPSELGFLFFGRSNSYTTGISQADTWQFKNFMVCDLTQMFGSTIADYIYSLDTASAGSGIAKLKSWGFFTEDYYAYSAPTLKSVEGLSAHVMKDADENVVASYPLDSTLTLRGVPRLDENNQLYFDGDEYASDGTVARRYGIIDLGTLSWTKAASEFRSNQISNIKVPASQTLVADLVYYKLSKYELIRASSVHAHSAEGIGINTDGAIWGYTSELFEGDATAFKTAMNGVYLVYALATPTTETADPYTNPQVVDPSGTEEYVTTGIVPVGHITKYRENIRAKIDGLPWDLSMIAPIDNGTTATRAYSTGQYFMHNNQFCKAKTSIASGATFTLNTNYEVTTVAAELYSALNS